MRKPQRQAISREINHRMSDDVCCNELHVEYWSGDLASASLTIVFDSTENEWSHQNMKTLFDLCSFFGAKPENVRWWTKSYDTYGVIGEELHVHFSGVDLTCFNNFYHRRDK